MGDAPKLQPRLGLFSASTIIIGSMIGSGIFVAPSIMAGYVQSPGILIGLWIFGGLFTLFGALSYGELAAMAPHAGGQYVFLRDAYGKFWGFLYGWTLFLVIQTGFNAAVSIAFGKYLGVFFPVLGEQTVLLTVPLANQVPALAGLDLPAFLREWRLNSAQLVACGVIVVLTGINILGVREGAFVQNLFTVLKVAALAALIFFGLRWAGANSANFLPLWDTALGPTAVRENLIFPAALAVCMSKALFAYDSWNTATFVAEEVRNPQRTLPRALWWGTLITTLIYVLTVVSYLALMSIQEMAAVPENRVAQRLAQLLFGDVGVSLIVVAILISTFGCVNGLILSGARVCFAMAREGVFFRSNAVVSPATKTPANALLYQGFWSCVLTVTGSYDDLLTYTTFASVLFGALTVAGVYRLRATQPNRPRPYRCWGYPVTPALYLVIAVPFLVYVIQGAPGPSLVGLFLVLTGVPFYLIFRKGTVAQPAGLR
jgi:APA family basic amino acid/polyamine antiporter